MIIIIMFTAAPSGPPKNVSGYTVSSTSIKFMWSPPEFVDQNGVIRSYSLTVTQGETSNVTTYATINTEYILSGLHPAYKYQFQAAALTVAKGPLSQPMYVYTLEEGEYNYDD